MFTKAETAPTLDLQAMRASAAQAAQMLKRLGNQDRLLLLCQLTQGERCVSELEAMSGISQPTLSQQLTVLRTDGLVGTRRDGKRIYYHLADEKVLTLLGTLYQLYCQPGETNDD